MPQKGTKVPVSLRALIARINRKLKPEYQQLKKPSSERLRNNVGSYYVIDLYRNRILDMNVNPERLGRQLGVLKDYEEIIE